jgi:hypothetical protein
MSIRIKLFDLTLHEFATDGPCEAVKPVELSIEHGRLSHCWINRRDCTMRGNVKLDDGMKLQKISQGGSEIILLRISCYSEDEEKAMERGVAKDDDFQPSGKNRNQLAYGIISRMMCLSGSDPSRAIENPRSMTAA